MIKLGWAKNAIVPSLGRFDPATHRRGGRRLGFTLIECIAMMSFSGMLLSLSSVLMHRAFEVHRTALESLRQLDQINSWSERLRTDASQAVEVATASDLLLTRDNGDVIRYSIEQQRLVRSVLRGGQLVSHEAWNGWALSQVNWHIDKDGYLPLLEGKLDFTNAKQTRQPLEWLARLPQYSHHN